MIDKPLEAIEAADIESLCFRQVPESRTLEFKRELPGRTDGEVKEFLDDVVALANAQGGDLVFGLDAKKGLAAKAEPIDLPDRDKEFQRLENILRDSVKPRLNFNLKWIPYDEPHRGIVLLRVPASLSFPHMRSYRGSIRFCSRNSAGKYDMDVHELRQAFTQSEQLPARFRALHDEALSRAAGKDMPWGLDRNVPKVVATISPMGLFREKRDLPIDQDNAIVPRPQGRLTFLKTLEGILAGASTNDGTLRGYVLTHRSGLVEGAWTIGRPRKDDDGQVRALVWPIYLEQGLTDLAGATNTLLRRFAIDGPWVLLVTVLGISSFELMKDQHFASQPAWREGATFPALIAEDLSSDSLQSTLEPIFKSFWLLFGEERPPLE